LARIVDIGDPEAIAMALGELEDGRCVAIPTETVYGLAGDATSGEAVARIFEMKKRPEFNPLICHVSSTEMALEHGHFGLAGQMLAHAFWPGPLTIVAPKLVRSDIHDLALAGLAHVGLRMPRGPARDIIAQFGKPLAAPSANRSGRISPTTAGHVAEDFPDEDLLILDGGPCQVGLESTVVRLEGERLVLLRPGAVTADDLQSASGLPVFPAKEGAIEAPGMMASHYAPRAGVRLNAGDCPPDAALIAFGPGKDEARASAAAVENLSPAGNLREAAANLYAAMKRLDATGADLICVESVPETGLGIAINDRLRRAAAPRDPASQPGGANEGA
jgi:L-threonylcarbamoyladenylate synthase